MARVMAAWRAARVPWRRVRWQARSRRVRPPPVHCRPYAICSPAIKRFRQILAPPDIAHFETFGTIVGAGLSGAFHTWLLADHERSDQSLGPRSERTLRVGDRVWFAGSDGDVREYTGLLLRRSRTERFIDSGDFAKFPERCVMRGVARVGGKAVYAVDVTAERGETQTVYLDAVTGLIDRIAYDDDDGRATIDLSDWRSVDGHRFPFRSVASDGDHAFDTIASTTAVDVRAPIDASVFAPLVPRYIDMAAPETIPLDLRDGHFFASVRIDGRRYTFLIDTGAQNILLDKHVATQLGLAARRRARSERREANGRPADRSHPGTRCRLGRVCAIWSRRRSISARRRAERSGSTAFSAIRFSQPRS